MAGGSGGSELMTRRVIVIVVVVLLAVVFYFGFTSYDAKRAGGSGDVYSVDSPGKPRGASSAAVTSDAPDTPSAKPVDPQTVVYPPAAPQPATATLAAGSDDTATAPTNDTISPNPPNGEVFAGKGRYQLYRQGNITWRLDTDTGRACVIFATDPEWKKPRVYRAGCGSR
jgi:hypothetical protein